MIYTRYTRREVLWTNLQLGGASVSWIQRAACCRLPVSGRRGAQALLDSKRHCCQMYLAACCRKPPHRRLSKFSWLQEGNIQISYVQDSPWLSWSASPLVAFWFAVAQAKPGLATTLAIMHLWVAIKLGVCVQATNLSAHSSHVAFNWRTGEGSDETTAALQNNSIRFAFQEWGYDQHGSWSGCSNYIWTRAERFMDWAHEFLLGPVDEDVDPW